MVARSAYRHFNLRRRLAVGVLCLWEGSSLFVSILFQRMGPRGPRFMEIRSFLLLASCLFALAWGATNLAAYYFWVVLRCFSWVCHQVPTTTL